MENRRKPIPEAIQRRITKIFVTNLPEGCSGLDLANHVREFGQIYDLYIARKRDKGGNRFGFLSMLDVKDNMELLRNLRNIRMGNNKLWFNVARFILEDGEVNRHKDDPVKNTGNNQSFGNKVFQGSKFEPGDMSFKNMLVGKSIKIDDNDIGFSVLHGRAIVGRMVDVDALKRVYLFLHDVCPGAGLVQYLGGLDVLISFDNPELAISVLEAANKENSMFLSVCMWNGQPLSYERLAWIKVKGVPLHLFTNETLNSVGGLVGKVVYKASKLDSDGDLSFASIGILVGDGNKISEEIVMEWKNRKFRVWIDEAGDDWAPDFYPVLLQDDQAKDNGTQVDDSDMADYNENEDNVNARVEETPDFIPGHITGAGENQKGDTSNVFLESFDDGIKVGINGQSSDDVEEEISEFTPAVNFDFDKNGLEDSILDYNNKVSKRKKCKKSDLGRSSQNYISSNESLRVGKKPKKKNSDIFGLNGMLGISDSESSSGDEDYEEAQDKSFDLNNKPDEAFLNKQSSPIVAVSSEQEVPPDVNLEYKEVEATKSMGTKLGVNLENQDNLIMEAIVDEGVQNGVK